MTEGGHNELMLPLRLATGCLQNQNAKVGERNNMGVAMWLPICSCLVLLDIV